MSQTILGSSHRIPQAAVLDCDPVLVGDSLSVHLAQQSNSAAVWTLHVWVLIAQGWYHLGVINTLPPSLGDEPSRTVLIANCPGATGWRVDCECITDDEIAAIALQSSRCNSSVIGVEALIAGVGGITNVNIVSPLPLPVAVVSFLPNPLPVTGVITGAVTATITGPLPLPTIDTAWSETFSTALANSFVIKASPGTLRSITLRLDGAAASATYYLQLWNLAAVPADATAVSLVNSLAAPVKQVHVTTVDDTIRWDFDEGGIAFSAGASMNLSSTEFTKTSVAGSLMSVLSAEYR